jgi:hypothetical protein
VCERSQRKGGREERERCILKGGSERERERGHGIGEEGGEPVRREMGEGVIKVKVKF